jgi:predicted Zn-dependent peptidase
VKRTTLPSLRPLPRARLVLLWTACLLIDSRPLEAQQSSRPEREEPSLEQLVEAFQLDNGWQFLLLPRRDAPVVSFETWVDTGSRFDPPARSGTANLMKNLLFKGSDRIGTLDWAAESLALDAVDQAAEVVRALEDSKDATALAESRARFAEARKRATALTVPEEFSLILEEAGGASTLNAYVSPDATRFVVSLPSNQLELWCWLESERFARPVFRDFHAERDALLQDRRSRVEPNPERAMSEALLRLAYTSHPYRLPATGLEEDLSQLTRAEVRAFFEASYGAQHMTTAIVGDFDPGLLKALLERYFGPLPPGPPHSQEPAVEPMQERERRSVLEAAAAPAIELAWHVPGFAAPDRPAVDTALRLLGYSRSSRLERRLVREGALASELTVTPSLGGDQLRGLVMIRAVPLNGVDTGELELAIREELERLAEEGPTAEELAGIKRAARAEHLGKLRENASIARALAEHQVKSGSWRELFRRIERLEAVSAADVQRALVTYFRPERCSVVASALPARPTQEDSE